MGSSCQRVMRYTRIDQRIANVTQGAVAAGETSFSHLLAEQLARMCREQRLFTGEGVFCHRSAMANDAMRRTLFSSSESSVAILERSMVRLIIIRLLV